ncbi:MAG: LysR family transcriptional regulator [Clostridia bacterium]|nr:LysR family transcriptional regulator [Clostridia bacterium]
MDFKQLESFVAAVNEGSFSNAADRLQLSQSMVTIHIRNLEKELGTRLLNRTTRSMELSQDGRTFYGYAREMLKLNRDSILALSRADKDDKTIGIVATPFISRYYLADWVIGFNRLHPDINFEFYTGYNSEIHGKLEKDGREFAFCNMKIMNSDYTVRHCGIANLVVITPNDARFRALGSQPFPLALFGEVPMITRSSTSTLQQEFMRWMKQSIPDTKLNVAAAIDDTETIKRLVAAGVGVSVISEVAARQYVEEGRVLSFPLEGTMPYHLYFVYKKKFLSPEQTLFRDFILEQVAHVDRPAED